MRAEPSLADDPERLTLRQADQIPTRRRFDVVGRSIASNSVNFNQISGTDALLTPRSGSANRPLT